MGDLRSAATPAGKAMTNTDSALCTECPVVALAGRSLSVTANVRAKGCRALVLACDLFMKPSLSHRGVRTSEGVDLWPLRATSIALEVSAADVPDNRPLSLIAWTGGLSAAGSGGESGRAWS